MPRGVPNNLKSLSEFRPDIALEWNYNKNNEEFGENFNPNTVSYGSHKSAWWICKKGHEYKTGIYITEHQKIILEVVLSAIMVKLRLVIMIY